MESKGFCDKRMSESLGKTEDKPKRKKAKKTNHLITMYGLLAVLITLWFFSLSTILTLAQEQATLQNQISSIQNYTEAQREFNTQVIQWSQTVGNRLITLENNTNNTGGQ